jgi:hypothetical protein
MSKWKILIVLLFTGFLPFYELSAQECEKYGNEMASFLEQMGEMRKELEGKTIMSEAEGEAFGQRMKALSDKSEDARKRWMECMGMLPVSKAESNQTAAKNEARAKEAEKEFEKQFKELVPEDVAIKAGAGGGADGLSAVSSLFSMLMSQEPEYKEAPVTGGGSLSDVEFRTPEEKARALRAVNAELESLPVKLSKKEDAPDQAAILKLAAEYSVFSQKNLKAEDLSEYSRAVTWTPVFNGEKPNPTMAKNYSFSVSSVTNYFNKPYFIMAYATAVFSLDPKSITSANNLAAAIAIAGKRLYPDKTKAKNLEPFNKSAEAIYLYALSLSMDKNTYTDESLVSLINLGNLYIDMNKLDEARSLMQAARKQSPYSWDAAIGMAAYFHSINKPDKARAILDDENLDRPQTLMVAKKASKALEKTKDLPIDSPEELYKENIKTITSEPIVTAADFMAQIDEEKAIEMRRFVENLPPQGSFKAPSIKKLTQYASLKAINSPQGESAVKDFADMLQRYSISSFASLGQDQMKMLERLGIDADMNVDLNDVVRNPEKYRNMKKKPKVKVDKSAIKEKMDDWKREGQRAKADMKKGDASGLADLVSQYDPSIAILQIDPYDYADPMNVIIQKHNFAVHNRKSNLYRGYLHSINRRLHRALNEILEQYRKKITEAKAVKEKQLEQFNAQKKAAGAKAYSAEWKLREHNIHVAYFNSCNNAAEVAFGSAANLTATTYTQKIKPTIEAYYYDVIRHVALISDPEVRIQKDTELRQSIYSAMVYSLSMVGAAHSSFEYHDEWDCDCDIASLLQQREMEAEERRKEENDRIQSNKAAKKAFDSGEIPESTPLFKKIDGYGFDFDYFFFKGRMSPARTTVRFNMKLPIPGSPEIFLSQSVSEFTGTGTYGQGIKLTLGAKQGGVQAGAYFDLSSSVTMDGQGVVQDYSVTAATGLRVSANNTSLSVGGQLTFGPGGEVRDSNFSAGVKQDFKNGFGGTASVSIEASTKQGCKYSGAVEQTIDEAVRSIKEAKKQEYGEMLGGYYSVEDLYKKKVVWPGNFKK